MDTSQYLAQLIRDHGSRSVFANEDPMFGIININCNSWYIILFYFLGKCLMQAGEVLRFTEVLRSQIVSFYP